MTTMLPKRKNKNTKKLAKTFGKLVSTELRSLDNLLRILPNGTLSKNSFNGENRRLLIIDSWIIYDILGLEIAKIMALKKAKTP
jgi:hypothetical protein